MGYTTDFFGKLSLSQPLTVAQFTYLNKLADTRRMKRDPQKLFDLFGYTNGHPGREKTSPENYFGRDGEFFVGGGGSWGQGNDASIIDYNEQPISQPGLWLKWVIVDHDGVQFLKWNGMEKFYRYSEWLVYLVNNFFEPWGVKLNGTIEWRGEERSDVGMIVVKDNDVKVCKAKLTYDEE